MAFFKEICYNVFMNLFKREKYLRKIRPFYEDTDIIKVITGIRRCGKSSLMYTIANELREKNVPNSNIVFIDLDSYGFKNIKTQKQLEDLINNYKYNGGIIYLFIDEIQNVFGFEETINALRLENKYSIFITGSNSYLLSGELVTKLTGRYIEFELFTLGFDEYIDIKKYYNINVNENKLIELNNYILEGGFPRTVFIENLIDKRTYVNSVIKEIFEKDIRRNKKIRKVDTFETIQKFVINNFGLSISINNIKNELKKVNNFVTYETIEKDIDILKSAKILYECDRFDMKSKKMLAGEKKYYLADLSLYFALNTDNRINFGQVLENIVYQYAKSNNYFVSVGRIGNLECDFILRKDMDYSYVQVAYTINENKETENREYRSLEMIKDNYKKYVLTTDYLLQKRNGIYHKNLMDFICEKENF